MLRIEISGVADERLDAEEKTLNTSEEPRPKALKYQIRVRF